MKRLVVTTFFFWILTQNVILFYLKIDFEDINSSQNSVAASIKKQLN